MAMIIILIAKNVFTGVCEIVKPTPTALEA
jgi:hypothetical protein